jgi:glycosyltransferase involved in cell wall biosynthesis
MKSTSVCFFSPYLTESSMGGGEKHLFDIALVIARKHKVTIAINRDRWQDADFIKTKYQDFLGKDLSQLKFISTPLFSTNSSFWQKLMWTKKFDYLFYWTDGSLFFSLAKINNLHIQIPFTHRLGKFERLKLMNWQLKNTNSEFTKNVIEESWKTKINFVHYPLIDSSELKSHQPKEKIILNVGRFFKQLHSKRQDVLVEIFEQLRNTYPKLTNNYKLVLIGAVEDEDYLRQIKQLAVGLPVEFYHNLSRTELVKWYKKSQIYWHATGYEINEKNNPEKVEHFGISTIEAMSASAIPIVINKGGQKEILSGDLSDLLWNNMSQAVEITARLIQNPKLQAEKLGIIKHRLEEFETPKFEQRVWEMFESGV